MECTIVTHKQQVQDCGHNWTKDSGFYVRFNTTYEEPKYYPPQGLMPIEVCASCGLMRLPKTSK